MFVCTPPQQPLGASTTHVYYKWYTLLSVYNPTRHYQEEIPWNFFSNEILLLGFAHLISNPLSLINSNQSRRKCATQKVHIMHLYAEHWTMSLYSCCLINWLTQIQRRRSNRPKRFLGAVIFSWAKCLCRAFVRNFSKLRIAMSHNFCI